MGDKNQTKLDRMLDTALENTFPASDPVALNSVRSTEPPGSDPDRRAPMITREQVEAAAPQIETCPRCNGTGRAEQGDGECSRCNGTGRVVTAG
jgi:hypothetical protein